MEQPSENWHHYHHQNLPFMDPSQINLSSIGVLDDHKSPSLMNLVVPKSQAQSPENMPTWTYGTPPQSFSSLKQDKGPARRRLDLVQAAAADLPGTSSMAPEGFDYSFSGLFQGMAEPAAPPPKKSRAGKRKCPGANAGGSPEGKASSRLDNSLLMTTRKFLALRDENNVLNLNEAAKCLDVPKRRLYDITNVLEGIDLVEKIGKNSIRWKTPECDERELFEIHAETVALEEEENHLNRLIEDVTSCLKLVKDDPIDKPYSYVRFSELRSIGDMADQTLIAIKAPQDSYSAVEVADPVTTGKFQLMIRNTARQPLTALLCPAKRDQCENLDTSGIATEDGLQVTGNPPPTDPTLPGSSKILDNSLDQDVVIPPTLMRRFSGLEGADQHTTPGRYGPQFQSPGIFMSPLKMLAGNQPNALLTPVAPTLQDLEGFSTSSFLPLEPNISGDGEYSFPVNNIALADLYGDWSDLGSVL